MTSAELLARLAQRPEPCDGSWAPQAAQQYKRMRAEFDRALLLDAASAYLDDQGQPLGDDADILESIALGEALETIIATIRSNP